MFPPASVPEALYPFDNEIENVSAPRPGSATSDAVTENVYPAAPLMVASPENVRVVPVPS